MLVHAIVGRFSYLVTSFRPSMRRNEENMLNVRMDIKIYSREQHEDCPDFTIIVLAIVNMYPVSTLRRLRWFPK